MASTMKQTELVKAYLETHYGITAKQAMEELGIYRLGARIWDLKRQGLPIKSAMIDVPTRNGETTKVKMYWLPGKPYDMEGKR